MNRLSALKVLRELASSTYNFDIYQAVSCAIGALEREISMEKEVNALVQDILLSKSPISPKKTKAKVTKVTEAQKTPCVTPCTTPCTTPSTSKINHSETWPLNARHDKENQYADDYEIYYDFEDEEF